MTVSERKLIPILNAQKETKSIGFCPSKGQPIFHSQLPKLDEYDWLDLTIDCPICSINHTIFAISVVEAAEMEDPAKIEVDPVSIRNVLTSWWNEILRMGFSENGKWKTVDVGQLLDEESERYNWEWEPYNSLLSKDMECPVCEKEVTKEKIDPHHWTYDGYRGEDDGESVERVTWLCRKCHNFLHDGERVREQAKIAEKQGFDDWRALAITNLLHLFSRYHQRPVDQNLCERVADLTNFDDSLDWQKLYDINEVQEFYDQQYPVCEDEHGTVKLIERADNSGFEKDIIRCSECGYRFMQVEDDFWKDNMKNSWYMALSEREIRDQGGDSGWRQPIDLRPDARVKNPSTYNRPPRSVEETPTNSMQRNNSEDELGYDLYE